MKIVCISGKAGSGKDTVGCFLKTALESYDGYNRVLITHFADPLKFVCKNFWDWDGKKDHDGRALLQYVGTDVFRARDPDFWVNLIACFLSGCKRMWDYVIIPDCRFPNEYEQLKKFGFDTVLMRVERPDGYTGLSEEQKEHISETALDGYRCDFTIPNTESLEDLRKIVRNTVYASEWFTHGSSYIGRYKTWE